MFDGNGQMNSLPTFVNGRVINAAIREGYVYLLTDSNLLRIDTKTGARNIYQHSFDNARLVILDGGEVLICTQASAYYIAFN